MPKRGWLNRQFDQVSRDVETWPEWMKEAAGFKAAVDRQQHTDNQEDTSSEASGPQRKLQL